MIGSGAVFVELERCDVGPLIGGSILSSGEQEAVIIGGGCSHSAVRGVDGGSAESVVAVLLDHHAAGIGKMSDTAFVILLQEVPVPRVGTVGAADKNVVVEVPNRGLKCARIVKRVIGMAIAVEISNCH